ncbi:MAG: hypothetical protein IT378_21020, partial [Sandaracinaceae bacterium]|nr:hypothetical protein [Sandaracinaceae bacterium]
MQHRLAVLVLSGLTACTNAPAPSVSLLVSLDIASDGTVTSARAREVPSDAAAYAVPRSAGNVHVELVTGGAASWEGFRDVSFIAIHERFEPNRLFGFAQEVPSRTIHVLVPRDPNATEISLRVSVSPDRLGAPVTTTRTIPIGGEPVGASTAPLVAAGPDVA